MLVQAARSAAEADGLKPPEVGDKEKEAKENEAKKAEEVAIERARQAAAVAEESKKAAAEVPSAGSAAHAMMANTASRKSPAAPAAGASNKKKGPPLRRGKWTPEEEAYANRLIQEFKAGLLPLTDGTTLRTFLSKLLNCDPMRISKKFVGSNCIGKQVFRRRTADINRLTPEQIQQSRNELSELERRFLERVAQTNRVKSSGPPSSQAGQAAVGGEVQKSGLGEKESPPSPPWLQAPLGYKQGTGAAMAAAALQGSNNRAAAAGRALLGGAGASAGGGGGGMGQKKNSLTHSGSAGLLAFAELQARRSQQNLLNMGANRSSASNLLAAASAGSNSGLSSSAMAQIARNASAARLAGLTAAGNSMNNLMLKTGLSRDQLTQLAREQGMTPNASLNNMMERQSSFDALMSLDFQSLQSIDNLANLIQTGGKSVPEIGMKNADFSSNGLAAAAAAAAAKNSSGNLGTSLANARRLASAGRMESLLRSLSSGNVKNAAAGFGGSGNSNAGGGSNANFSNLLQSMQSNLNSLGGSGNSANSLFGSGGANSASALSLANMLRADSSTGLTALRQQDGLTQRKTSVDDFLSLVASGDIPHQDPTLLNVPLMQQQAAAAAQQSGNGSSSSSGAQAAATYLAQQQLLAQAANSGNAAALTSALARAGSFSNFGSGSHASLAGSQSSLSQLLSRDNSSSAALKRKLMEMGGDLDGQGDSKR